MSLLATFSAGVLVSAPVFAESTCADETQRAQFWTDRYLRSFNECTQRGYSFNVCYESTSVDREYADRANLEAQRCLVPGYN
jgi:hypothetical protein